MSGADVTLEKAMYHIRKLVKAKQHEDTTFYVPMKLLFAIVEIAEAADEWKKHGYANAEHVAEELVDAMFYLLDAYGMLVRDVGVTAPSAMFLLKLSKNWQRAVRYGRPDEVKQE